MKVLVTGGNGFVGRNLQLCKPDWVYVSSNDYDLVDSDAANQMFLDIRPDAVIHLAARVGGIKDNFENQATFFHQNVMINTNVIHYAFKTGVTRLMSSLSTCAFPDTVEKYPLNESDILKGPPAKTNFSYGYSKRMLHIQSLSYRRQHGVEYSTFCPSNIYGPNDHFDSDSSHFVPSLVSKIARAKSGDEIEIWGTGKPLRQQLYVSDLCNLIIELLANHRSDIPVIVSPDENLSISEMADIIIRQSNKDIKISFNGNLDGQFRKDGSNSELSKIIGKNFNFTSFSNGAKITYDWYVENILK
tara:strand:+ start:3742 stop:4647 length:906 start_codon:yes stop_codon:yes gene_type:complete